MDAAAVVDVSIETEDGRTDVLGEIGVRAIPALLRRLGPGNAVLVLELPHATRRLLIAVSRGRAFIGRDGSDGVYQFSRPPEPGMEPASLRIGGQDTEVDARFVFDIETTTEIVRRELADESGSGLGEWERR